MDVSQIQWRENITKHPQKLAQTKTVLLYTKGIEKRAEVCIENLLRELKEQQKISEKAQQMLEEYQGLIYCPTNSAPSY